MSLFIDGVDVSESEAAVGTTSSTLLATTATSAVAAIPTKADGSAARFVRLSSTQACYVHAGLKPGASSAVIAAAGTGYIPGEHVTLTGGTQTANAVLAVATTKVVSASIDAAGTGGTPGTATVTGTTGTGTKFQATVTIGAGGDIESVDSISVAGSYTANPTSIASEPVTGAGLTGAKLTVVMGVATVTVFTAGSYSVLPSNPVSQGSTNGSGTGATFTVTWTGTGLVATSSNLRIAGVGDTPIIDVSGMTHIAGLRVSADGSLQISPIENR